MPKCTSLSLRKSCEACVKAKRRCDAQLPQCSRCFNKALTCSYDNEPLANQEERPISFASAVTTTCEMTRGPNDPAHNWHSILSPFTHAPRLTQSTHELRLWNTECLLYEPAMTSIPLHSDDATVQYLVNQLKEIPFMFARERCTPFIHSQIYEEWLPRQIQDVYTICGSYSLMTGRTVDTIHTILGKRLGDLVRNYKPNSSFEELLASVHALMLYLLIHLFDNGTRVQRLGELYLATLARWTCQLWQQAPSQIPDSLTPWQAWVFAETVRRTILISYLIRGVYSEVRLGYCLHQLMVSALPFDGRTCLWEPKTATAWETLDPGRSPSMVSFREYTDDYAKGLTHPRAVFETLLLVARHGRKAVEMSAGSHDLQISTSENLPEL